MFLLHNFLNVRSINQDQLKTNGTFQIDLGPDVQEELQHGQKKLNQQARKQTGVDQGNYTL